MLWIVLAYPFPFGRVQIFLLENTGCTTPQAERSIAKVYQSPVYLYWNGELMDFLRNIFGEFAVEMKNELKELLSDVRAASRT